MKIYKKTAVALALAAGVLGSAQADVLAQNVLQLTNLRFLNADGSTVSVSQFTGFSASDSADHTASLNGAAVATSLGPAAPAAVFDLAQVCLGSCGGFAENDFSLRPDPATLNVARSDSRLAGAPVNGLPGGVTSPASASTVAEAQLISGGTGSAQTNMGLLAQFTFITSSAGPITVAFDALNYLIAHIGGGSTGSAQATSGWVISLTRAGLPGPVFSWSPDGSAGGITGGTENTDPCILNGGLSTLSTNTFSYNCAGSFSATTNPLLAGVQYNLSIRHSSFADVTQLVPEPGSLVLAGLGLLMVAGAARRKASK